MPVLVANHSLSECSGSSGCMGQCHDGLVVEINEKLPGYPETAELVPMTPSQNDRYDRQILVSPEYMAIPMGLHSSVNLPELPFFAAGWSGRINPEGSPYRVHAEKHVVTDIPMDRADIVLYWAKHFEAKALDIALPEDYEVYLNPDTDGKTCKYYFVDHLNCTVFWLNDVDPYRHGIDLPPACSVGHLKFLLQEQYWKHCEYFPHRRVPAKLKKELISIFTQARADLLTSLMSTFPYTADECAQFLEILKNDTVTDEYDTWITARLWGIIARHRYHTFCGEDYARISRDQRRYDKAPVQRSLILDGACTCLLFNIPSRRAEELRLLFVDDIAFGKHWREFAPTVIKEWKESCVMAVGLVIPGVASALRPMNPVSASFAMFSVTLGLGAVASGALMLHKYAGAENHTAAMAADHLLRVQHPKLGFQPIAAIYALPRALALWSLVFLAGHILIAFVDLKGVFILIPAIAFTVLFILFFIQANMILTKGFNHQNTAEQEAVTQ